MIQKYPFSFQKYLLPSRADNESLTGLLEECCLEEVRVVLLGLHLHDAGPHHVPLDLQQPLEVLQPLHLVVQVPWEEIM